jgi:hypothetical protein
MILSDDEIKERIESPLNLLNRLKTTLNRAVHPTHPSLPPTAEEIIPDLQEKLKDTTLRSKASAILMSAMTELQSRIPEVQKPEKLAQIAREMSSVISNQDNKPAANIQNAQIIVYAPQIQSLDNFDIIDVAE